MSIKNKANNILTNIFLFVMIGILTLSIIFVVTGNSQEPKFIFNHRLIYLTSGSMEPTIKTNAMALTKKIENDNDIQVGDIVSFKLYDQNNKMIRATHRVVEIDKNNKTIITKGDNNRVTDAYPIKFENVESKVIFVMNWTAYIIDFLGFWWGIIANNLFIQIILAAVIIGIFSFIFIRKIQNDSKKQK